MKRAILFYAIALLMCHLLERLTGTGWGTVVDAGYFAGLAIYLFAFTVIYEVISKKDYSFKRLWMIGALIGGLLIELPLGLLTTLGIMEGGIPFTVEGLPGFLIVIIFFWGLLYTATNYSVVKYISRRLQSQLT